MGLYHQWTFSCFRGLPLVHLLAGLNQLSFLAFPSRSLTWEVALENSWYFTTAPLVFPWNDISVEWLQKFHTNDTSLQDLCSALDWLKICFIQSEALLRSGYWRVITDKYGFLGWFLRCHFAGRPVVALSGFWSGGKCLRQANCCFLVGGCLGQG